MECLTITGLSIIISTLLAWGNIHPKIGATLPQPLFLYGLILPIKNGDRIWMTTRYLDMKAIPKRMVPVTLFSSRTPSSHGFEHFLPHNGVAGRTLSNACLADQHQSDIRAWNTVSRSTENIA